MSAAAVSGAVRYLQTVGYLQRVSQPGSRRELYAVHDAWYVASMRNSPIYESLAALTDATAATLRAGSAARSRVEEMARFYRFLDTRMPALLAEWEQEHTGNLLWLNDMHEAHDSARVGSFSDQHVSGL